MSSIIHNDPDSVKLRKNKSTLVALGTGIMAFGIWSIIKTMMEFLLGSAGEEIREVMSDLTGGGRIAVIAVTAFIVIVDLLIRCHVGINAIREGRNKKSRHYMFSVVLLIISSIVSLILLFMEMLEPGEISMNDEVSIFVEITSLVILIEMITVSVSTSKIKARASQTEVDHAG